MKTTKKVREKQRDRANVKSNVLDSNAAMSNAIKSERDNRHKEKVKNSEKSIESAKTKDKDNDKDKDKVKEMDCEQQQHDKDNEREKEKPENASEILSATTPPPSAEKVLYDNRIKRKNVLALNEKVAAIREYEKMPVYKRIGRMFHCSPDQIKRIVQQKDNILKAWEQRTRRCQDAKTLEMKVVRVSMLGKCVYDWIRRMMYYKDFMITDGLIQKMALQFKSAMGLQVFFPHQDWCDKFRQTYKITELDSKLLKIGYNQGHSVQIKDVIKDVLSECTPDVKAEKEDDDEELKSLAEVKPKLEPQTDEDDDDFDEDDDNDEEVAVYGNASLNNVTTKTVANAAATQQKAAELAVRPMQQLQPFRQLLVPIQNRPGMPQKVLVATPITTAGQMGGAGVKNGAQPLTMTIIPLATIAQPQQQQLPQQNANTNNSNNNNNKNNNSSNHEKGNLPLPIEQIKQEINDEPDTMQIKQECVSDDEADEQQHYQQQQQQQQQQQPQFSNSQSQSRIQTPVIGAANLFNARPANRKHLTTAAAASDAIDDDNIDLSSLRQLMQHRPNFPITFLPAANLMPTTANTVPTAQRTAATAATTTASTLPPLPPLTRAPTPQTRNALKRKHLQNPEHQQRSPSPTIQTFAEARKLLKQLENFALERGNFRLISLITRADELIRDQNGDDDDVDID